jgi:hypothetical protein
VRGVASGVNQGETTAVAIRQKEALVVVGVEAEHVLVIVIKLIHRAKFIDLHVDNTLHVASFHRIPGNLLREGRKLD